MRGVFFKQPIEFRLDVRGDEWRQGEAVAGTLTVKNRGAAVVPLADLYLHLAEGDKKLVKEKAADGFRIISSAAFEQPAAELGLNQEHSAAWSFSLENNCPVSDKTQSMYLVCGKGALAEAAGNLALPILPHRDIEAVLSLFETPFNFVLKGQKSKKGWLEARLKPPSGKDFPTLDHLMLSLRLEPDALLLRYCFHLKTLQASATTLEMKKAKRDMEQNLPRSAYAFPDGQLNFDALETSISETLAAVRSKMQG